MTDRKNNQDRSAYEDSEATYKSRLAREASRDLANSTDAVRTRALELLAEEIARSESKILAVNEDELTRATENSLDIAFVDRMTLNHERIAAICEGVREVANLPDPIGNIEDMSERPNGLKIGKMRVPLGVMASVYEARPNVTIDIAAITVKSGNAVILRSGLITIGIIIYCISNFLQLGIIFFMNFKRSSHISELFDIKPLSVR